MSRFSGKFDLYDEYKMIFGGDIDYFKKSKIYLGFSYDADEQKIIPGKQIHVEYEEDLVPYYAHVISMMNSDENGATIYLMDESWPDIKKRRAEECGYEFRMYNHYKEELANELSRYLVVKPQEGEKEGKKEGKKRVLTR